MSPSPAFAIVATLVGLAGTTIAYVFWSIDGGKSPVPMIAGVVTAAIAVTGFLTIVESRAHARFRPIADPPACGIDVVAGREAIVINGRWFALKELGTTGPAEIVWLPTTPECIEFVLMRGSDMITLQTLRVPVPPEARAEGRRVFDYWDRKLGPRTDDWQREWRYDPRRGPV
jgi:hypothetical protein